LGTSRLLLHVGYHKTATTWFQQRFFPALPDASAPWPIARIVEEVVTPSWADFDPEAVADRLERDALATGADAGDRVVVLSCERLSGSPHAGGYDSAEIARRLHAAFPDAKVWVAVREQSAAIASMYATYVHGSYGVLSLEDYLRDLPPTLLPKARVDHFRYSPLVSLYRELFGPDRVLVTLYEDFARSPDKVLDSLCDFAGLDRPAAPPLDRRSNHSLAPRGIRVLRQLNRVTGARDRDYLIAMGNDPLVRIPGGRTTRSLLRALDHRGFLGDHRSLEAKVGNHLGDHFVADNRVLARETGLDLSGAGWRV
jgi:Sulfotransferase family